jgi:protein farnesyltransferase/geranylgeranyltransferase type-1 subunit alpha
MSIIYSIQVWEHRRLIIERSGSIENERTFLARIIECDSKNYHAWQYRQWLLKTYSLWSDELVYIDELLCNDIRNNSAWNQRYFVIAHTTGFQDDIIERELDYVERHIRNCPDNESAWNYLRGIARFRSINLHDQRLWTYCQTLYDNYYVNDTLHQYQWRFLLAYMVELLIDDDRNDKLEDNKRFIDDLCEQLSTKVDPIRQKYWQHLREQNANK